MAVTKCVLNKALTPKLLEIAGRRQSVHPHEHRYTLRLGVTNVANTAAASSRKGIESSPKPLNRAAFLLALLAYCLF
ncbi:hypothetical protein DDN72_08855 [Vibrio cholerae]|nr:hypothetical protein [Vibrio cholerae]EGR1911541.1 hypothetical protein [Vibrio cholerae]EGR2012945.1 hypothetical protein [Vibrio cholerae]EGR2082336.1 hypothetical protein [Vibrio cholerae]EGR2525281.1 hypothetical protein [Vibrio cholerae]